MKAANRKSVWAAIFRRRGANGHFTRLFDDLDGYQKEDLLQHVNLSDNEIPVIGSIESFDRWLILTTQKVVWCLGGDVTTLRVDQIVDAIVDLQKLKEIGGTKLGLRELQINTQTGSYVIEVEPGAPLSGVWNVLQYIGAQNRRLVQ